MTRPTRIAVAGAGQIGQIHIGNIRREAELAAIVDPAPVAMTLAEQFGVPCFATLEELFAAGKPDGVVIATPNPLHAGLGLVCAAAGVPMLVEKPIADTIESAERLVAAAASAGVPILVGHHRRYNPLIRRAHAEISAGRLGKITLFQSQCWFYKPDDYFDVPWRREKGAGPVLTNTIHDIDLMRHLCGEVSTVQSMEASNARGHEVEDSAVAILRFASGALGTISVSDAVVAPWSWELAAGEAARYPRVGGTSCYMVGGTEGSLSLPDVGLWHYAGKKDWLAPISRDQLQHGFDDPMALQIRHFCDVIAGTAEPFVSGEEGLKTLRVLDAMKRSATSGLAVVP